MEIHSLYTSPFIEQFLLWKTDRRDLRRAEACETQGRRPGSYIAQAARPG